ncbi:MAG: hypothetical protein D6785_13240, partial [Planctomycetota bacterium]
IPHYSFLSSSNQKKFYSHSFLYLINPQRYNSKKAYLEALQKAPYPLMILDLSFQDSFLTSKDLARIRKGRKGRNPILLCYFSIGEAETYRYYWKKKWFHHPPSWLEKENPKWEGNFKVRYWHPQWQQILFQYLKKIIRAGFDGVYLDIVDAFEYFEAKYKQKKQKSDLIPSPKGPSSQKKKKI